MAIVVILVRLNLDRTIQHVLVQHKSSKENNSAFFGFYWHVDHSCSSRALMTAREKERRLRQIHQRQENRPAPPLPPTARNTHPPNTDSQEYRTLVDHPEPSTQTDRSSDGYVVPYQHMLDRFIAFMSMYQRRTPPRPPPMPPDRMSLAPSTMDRSDGYLEPRPDPHYQELNEASFLTDV